MGVVDRQSKAADDPGESLRTLLVFTLLGPLIGWLASAPLSFGLTLWAIVVPPAIYTFGGLPAVATGMFAIWYRRRARAVPYVAACAVFGAFASPALAFAILWGGGGEPDIAPAYLLFVFAVCGAAAGAACAAMTRPRLVPLHPTEDAKPRITVDSASWTGRH